MQCARRTRRVLFIEPTVHTNDVAHATFDCLRVEEDLVVARFRLPVHMEHAVAVRERRRLLDQWLLQHRWDPETLWYSTPAAIAYTAHLHAAYRVYDCVQDAQSIGDLSESALVLERQLVAISDVVFASGWQHYYALAPRHSNCHVVPNGVDVDHFATTHNPRPLSEPLDQQAIPRPRVGYCGVLDARLDWSLIASVAEARPEWQFVFVGPVANDATTCPRGSNLHYLGARPYQQLPAYFSGWDAGWIPLMKTPGSARPCSAKAAEYLAAGLPAISTVDRETERHWGRTGLIRMATTLPALIASLDAALETPKNGHTPQRLRAIAQLLTKHSWEATWARMQALMVSHAQHAA